MSVCLLPSHVHPWLGPGCRHQEWDVERVKPSFTLPMGDAPRPWKKLSDITFGVWGWIFGWVFFSYLPQMENFSAHMSGQKSWEQD